MIQLRKNNITDLLNLQGVLVKKRIFSKDSIQLWIELKRNEQVCPCCKHTTSRVHDYYTRFFKHIMIGKKFLIYFTTNADMFV